MQKTASKGGFSRAAILDSGFLHPGLSNADLIKRLKAVTDTLENYGDDDDEVDKAKSETFHLSSALGEDWLLEHKNKDVRLLVACALADVLRIFAPEPPYEEETNADVIKLFIKILRGFQSPDMTPQHPSYNIHFYLLERLSNISIFSIIPELETYRDELLKMLVQAAYDIAGDITMHSATSKITEHLASIICSVVEDMALMGTGIQVELLDLMVCALCQEEKQKNYPGFLMMRKVISSCPNNFQPFLERQLHQVKTGVQLDSDLTNKDRLAEAVFELSSQAPKCLTGVLGAYAEDLLTDDQQMRIKAVKLLGAVFAVGQYHVDFSQAFSEFKRRSVDKDSDVRKALVSVMQALVTKRPDMGKLLMEDDWTYMGGSREAPLLKLVADPDESVRKEAVCTVFSACLANSESTPQGILECVAERILDKKPGVRKVAMEGLAKLWQKYCAPFEAAKMPKNVSEKFSWIPAKLLTIAKVDSATRQLFTTCVEDICLSPLNDQRSVAEVAIDFYSSLDAGAKNNMIKHLKFGAVFRQRFVEFCELREQVANDMEEDGEKREASMLQKLSNLAWFSDPGSVHDHLQKLHNFKGQSSGRVWEQLEKLARAPLDHARTLKLQEEVLKKLGPKHPQLAFVKTLIARLSDKCFGVDFIRQVLGTVIENEGNRGKAAADCLTLVPELARLDKNFVTGEEKSLGTLLTSRCDDLVVCENLLKTVAMAGDQLSSLGKSKDGIETIRKLCLHESWNVAKYAVRALVALGCDDKAALSKIAQKAAENVTFGSKLPSALRVITEVAKACPEAVEKEREAVTNFVRKKLLAGAWPVSAGKKDRNTVIDSKAQGLKMLTILSLHDDETSVLELCEEIITKGGEIQSGDSTPKQEKAILRKTAGCCIIRMAKADGAIPIPPCTFAALSMLFEDEDKNVKEAMLHKVFKGTAQERGKLSFHFASLFALVAHDPDPVVLERGKKHLRDALKVMACLKQGCGSEAVTMMAESLLAWLLYALVVHREYADPDEDTNEASLAFKKHLELFFNCVPPELQNAAAMQQVVEHIRKRSVPALAASRRPVKVIERNVSLVAEVAHRLLKNNKRWTTKGLASDKFLSKVVPESIFSQHAKGTAMDNDFAPDISPVKAVAANSKSTSKKAAKPTNSAAASALSSPVKSPLQSSRNQMHSEPDDFHAEPLDMDVTEPKEESPVKRDRPDPTDLVPAKARNRSKKVDAGEEKGVGGRIPQVDDMLEFEMSEPSAPDGVEWLPGVVVKVDLKKKTFKTVIKEDEDDKTTWNEEIYKFSDEGKEWRWPAEVSMNVPPGRKSSSSTAAKTKAVTLPPAPKAESKRASKPKARHTGVVPQARPSAALTARPSEAVSTAGSAKKTPATKRKSPSISSTPSSKSNTAFDDFDEMDGGDQVGELQMAKSKSPQGAEGSKKKTSPVKSKPPPARARESGVVRKARESAIVTEQSSQALWQQALSNPQGSVPVVAAPKQVKRRKI